MTLCKRALTDQEWTGEGVVAVEVHPPQWPATFIAEVVDASDAAHPGRLRCRWRAGHATGEHWLPTTRGVAAQVQDRVLCILAEDSPEPIVTAIVDGLSASRPRAAPSSPRLRLQPDEALCIEAADGTPLLEVRAGEQKAVVTLLQHDTEVTLEGALTLSAKSVAIEAREGDLTLAASGDAKVTAELIHLN